MAEENQETTRGPKEVTTKDLKRAEVGRKLQEYNHRMKEEREAQKYANQYVIGVVLAVGVIGGLGYYLYQAKKGVEPPQQPPMLNNSSQQPPKANKFEMD